MDVEKLIHETENKISGGKTKVTDKTQDKNVDDFDAEINKLAL